METVYEPRRGYVGNYRGYRERTGKAHPGSEDSKCYPDCAALSLLGDRQCFFRHVQTGRITLEQAKTAIEVFEQIPLTYVEIDLDQAIGLSSQLNIYAYDSYMIACAMNHNCALLSLDSGLIRAANDAGVDVLEVLQTDADIP